MTEDITKKASKSVTIQVKNAIPDKTLTEPSYYVTTGKCFTAMSEIPSDETQKIVFGKTPWSMMGASGVVTFRIKGSEETAVIYFCNPYFGHNQFGFSWDPIKKMADKEVAKPFSDREYENFNHWIVRGTIGERSVDSKSGYRISGNMSQSEHAEFKVRISRLEIGRHDREDTC